MLACASKESGAIVLDFEDGVSSDRKDVARDLYPIVFDYLSRFNENIFCRVNNDEAHFNLDLRALSLRPPKGILIPKIETAAELIRLRQKVMLKLHSQIELIPIIETLKSVDSIKEILNSFEMKCVFIGLEDLAFELDVEPTIEGMAFIVQKIIFSASLKRIPVIGTSGPFRNFGSKYLPEYKRMLELSKSCGFKGSPAIHVSQIHTINQVFSYSKKELEDLKNILNNKSKNAVFGIDGQMVGPPILKRYKKVVEEND